MPHILVNQIRLYYEISGEGPPLLFIHGLGSSTRDWEYQIEYFSPQFQVITFDVRGHGKSQLPPGPYSIPLFTEDTVALMESLYLKPAYVVGISMGGMIAFQLALDRPDLVKGLVIINSAPELVVRTMTDRIELFKRLLIVRLLGMRKMGEVLGERLLPKEEQKELRELFAQHWAENDPRAYRDSMKALLGWSVTDRLREIRCPVLIVAADQDYTPVDTKRSYSGKIPDAQLVIIEDSRHATTIDQPERLNRAVEEFISNHEQLPTR